MKPSMKDYTQLRRICYLKSQLFAEMKLFEIKKLLRDFVFRYRSSLNFFAFCIQVPDKSINLIKEKRVLAYALCSLTRTLHPVDLT